MKTDDMRLEGAIVRDRQTGEKSMRHYHCLRPREDICGTDPKVDSTNYPPKCSVCGEGFRRIYARSIRRR